MATLYTPPDFWRSYPILISAQYSGAQITVVPSLPGFKGEESQETDHFLSNFSLRKVPAFEENGFRIQEASAISNYVANDVLRGTSPQDKALVQQWVNLAEGEIVPSMAAWVYPAMGVADYNEKASEKAKEVLLGILSVLNLHLLPRTFLVGDTVTLADISVACTLLLLFTQVMEPSMCQLYLNVTRWFCTCVHQPQFLTVLGDVTLCETAARVTGKLKATPTSSVEILKDPQQEEVRVEEVQQAEEQLQQQAEEQVQQQGEEQVQQQGEEQVQQQGEEQVQQQGEEQVQQQGEEQVQQQGEEQVQQQGEEQVQQKGEEQVQQQGEEQVQQKGEEQVQQKGEEQVQQKGEEQVQQEGEEQVQQEGEEQVQQQGEEQVQQKGEEQVQQKGEEQVQQKGEEQVQQKGEEQVQQKGEEQVQQEGEEQVQQEGEEQLEQEAEEQQQQEEVEDGPDATEEAVAAEPKAKDPFASLPKSSFVLDEFKRTYSNEDTLTVALPYLWEKLDREGWSLWYCEYKYPGELGQVFMSCNLITGMFQRLDRLRKHAFASVALLGTDGDSSISGVWLHRGQQLAFELCADWKADYESYSWRKLDPDSDETRTLVREYLSWQGNFKHVGKTFNQAKVFK
ncbi:hypothetical protein SKAU_G00093320 [Synaphobranchus kaupii]|uniref:Elongation factor 1-gamma n=1 Tax=Synaphobranchus kaupii TaxID=118154 RepID=A0A9Q1J6E2_SYNKA|nr:hypothetical protein SKAU_G00093320 [Synaphobranchus kaupii]